MFSYYYFFCMVHGDRSKGSTFLELAEGGGNQEARIFYCMILKNPLLQQREKDEFKTRYDNMAKLISCL